MVAACQAAACAVAIVREHERKRNDAPVARKRLVASQLSGYGTGTKPCLLGCSHYEAARENAPRALLCICVLFWHGPAYEPAWQMPPGSQTVGMLTFAMPAIGRSGPFDPPTVNNRFPPI